jgi:glutamine synthetase
LVAYGFDEIYKRIGAKKSDKDVKKKALEVVKQIITETKDIRFEKNGYSPEWQKEAAKRGLPNAKNTPEALQFFLSEDVIKTFAKYNVLTERELRSKIEIKLENYIKTIEIEYKCAVKAANTLLLPAILKQINTLTQTSKDLSKINIKSEILSKEIKTLVEIYEGAKKSIGDMEKLLDVKNEEINETAAKFASTGADILASLRAKIDAAEDLVADEYWPMANYQKLLNAF